ncbi:MAG: penicillin-binding protein 2, partial [SAR324 cluster bacterium]|nr:penicillin-binding protein 2 [SAR324 cluster bacterium]
YPPGSIFKVFMAVAGLEEGVIREDETVNCPGYFYFGGRAFKCHKHSGHGSVDLNRAITLSCDVYFYTVGQRLGIDRIHEYATKFGLGLRTDPDFEQENPGLIPSTAWKKMYYEKDPPNQKWFPGETISVSIGQGATTTTPMQISRGVSALVNGGILYKPQLVRKIESVDGAFRDEDFKPVEVGRVDVQKRILNKVKEAMVSVVNDPHGTGKRAQLPKELGIQVGGKTGTAQVVSLDYHKSTEGREHHAWFVGFAPAEDPQIVVTALIEHGGGGGLNAAPLVRQVMEAFFGYVPPTPTPEPQVKRK